MFAKSAVVLSSVFPHLPPQTRVAVSMDAQPTARWSRPLTVTLHLDDGSELSLDLEGVQVRARGEAIASALLEVRAPQGPVLLLDFSLRANYTGLRLVGGELQVRGPRAAEVRAALSGGQVDEVGRLLDDLLENLRDQAASEALDARLGGWVPCRIAC